MTILVTGAAGFIGYHVAKALLERGDRVIGIDNLNDYYDPSLKRARLAQITDHARFRFEPLDLTDREGISDLFKRARFDGVVHLAAQAGVRYSINNPMAYADSNLTGFLTVLEACRHAETGHLVYASSSSVYGANETTPYAVEDNVDHPVSLYAATKKANELMAHSYAHLYGLPSTGLRFFTVYGPWGRPDMAPFLFAGRILAGEPIDVFNNGDHARDFTYIDDIVDGVIRVLDQPAKPDPDWSGSAPDPSTSKAPYRLYNIGNNQPVELMDFIAAFEDAIGREAVKRFLPKQPGDVHRTAANIDALRTATGFQPKTDIVEGVGKFIHWYRGYYGL